MDVECLEPVDASLHGFQLVLQMEDEGPKSLNNAVMASAPGHPLWLTMAHMLAERYHVHRHNISTVAFVGCPEL